MFIRNLLHFTEKLLGVYRWHPKIALRYLPIVAALRKAEVIEEVLENDCVLTGGETSEQPGVVDAGTYILTASIVGVVDKENIIDGSKIRAGDAVLALASSGIHTNGFSLVRKIMQA